uniref:DAGKa domain-containing protein n=1 Tax=Macrostomum lignano TaxID=282301 RepID=A0A1I8FAU0_9PLAT
YVTVTKETTAQETIVYALKKFGRGKLDASQLDLVEVSLDKQVSERTLAQRRETAAAVALGSTCSRVIDPRYTGLALYVGNLKTGMSQRVYEKILMEKLGSAAWTKSARGGCQMLQLSPMAIVPLAPATICPGAALGSGYYSGQEYPLNILRDVAEAEVVTLDRWTVIFHPEEKEKDETKVQLQYESNAANTNEDNASIFVMNNYFGIGVYFKMSVRKMMSKGSCKDLHRQIIVEVDGKVIDLPPLEGIIILKHSVLGQRGRIVGHREGRQISTGRTTGTASLKWSARHRHGAHG